MLFAGRQVHIGDKNCARGLEYNPRAQIGEVLLKKKGKVFPNTDRPRSANNVLIFFYMELLWKQLWVLKFKSGVRVPLHGWK